MPGRPVLIYDGDCGFCVYCVDFARSATGSKISFKPYQQVGEDYPAISEAEFKASIRLVHSDGSVSTGARAAFECLSIGGYSGFWLACYSQFRLQPLAVTVSFCCMVWPEYPMPWVSWKKNCE